MGKAYVRCSECGAKICPKDLDFAERMNRVRKHYRQKHKPTLW